jgi:putative ABC transport system permease protein
MLFIKLAWRNTLRNPRRTSLTVGVVAIGVAALVFAWSLFDGGNNQSINTMTGTFTGHVQIHRAGYTDDPTLDRTFASSEVDMKRLQALPGVQAMAPRLQAPVMVSTDAVSRGVLLVGVDPTLEKEVTTIHERLSQGQWFDPMEAGQIVLGNTLAKALEVGLGDEVTVLTQGLYGSIGAARYNVRGIYATGNEMVDGLQAFISFNDAAALLSAGDQLTTIAVRLDHYDSGTRAVEQFKALLPKDLEVQGWRELLPDVAQKVNFHEWVATIVMVMLFGVVMVGVTNTILMSTLERMREFGTIMALGTRPSQIFGLIMLEGAFLGLLGFAIGMAVGGGLVAHFNTVGIDFSGQSDALQQMPGLSTDLRPYLSVRRMLLLAVSVALVTVGAALYPALKTARLVPLVALRGLAGSATTRVRAGKGHGTSSAWPLVPLLAFRNMGRNAMRSLLTGVGVFFAMAAFVFLGAFVTGYYKQIVENSTGFITGDGQVQHQDFRARLEPALALDDGPALLERVAQVAGVRSASARAQSPGLVSSPHGAEPVQLLGVQADREQTVTFLYKSIQVGRYLDPDRDHEVVIGRKLAERLRVDVGEKVVVTGQDVHGALASEAFIVVGLFDTGSHSFDDTLAQVSLPALQRMLGMGDRYTSIAFRVRDGHQSAEVLNRVRAVVQQTDAQVYSWQALLPQVVQMNTMFKGSLLLVMLVVFGTISVVIMNTVLMSVMERTREFGSMLAIGSPPGLIVRLVVLEALVVGVIGAVSGAILSSLAAWRVSGTGLSMKSQGMTSIPGTTDVVYPQLSWAVTLQPVLLMLAIILVVSLYPAWRASRLEPVRAMRSV